MARPSRARQTSAPAFLGAMGQVASKPPVISKEGTALDMVDDGGAKDKTDLVYDEDDEILVDSGEKGVLGRELQLVSSDGQSNNSVWQQLARRMIQEDKVDVLVAGFASAEREAIRPIVDQFKQLYFYTNQYEGGVADANTFCTGPVCEQQVIPTVQYMVEKFGPRCYTIAADYNFGQLTAAWTRAYIPLVGGQIIGEEFIPLSVSEFSQVIARIQQANPDWVMTLLGRAEPSQLLPAGGSSGPEAAHGLDRQHGAGLRAQALQAALVGEHAQCHPVPAGGADRAQPRVRQALDGDVPRRSSISARWRRTPISPSISTPRRPVSPARPIRRR